MSVVIAVGWLIGWVLLWRLPRLPAARPGVAPAAGSPTVSVVIPARDEADRLPLLLAGLAAQTRPATEVVVVDDQSSDETAAVARGFSGVTVVPGSDLPDGWTGKCWACATGVRVTRGELIVFLDADVELEPEALEAAVATWAERGGLLSVQPHHHIIRPVEALSLPFNVIALMGLGIGSLLPPRREWAAAGPLMVIDRRTYDAVGGHAAVRDQVAEDLALATRVSAEGEPVRCLVGGDSVRFRMYRDLRGIVEGWSKNLASGARRTPPLRALATGWWITALLSMIGVLLGLGEGWSAGEAALAYGAGVVQIGAMSRQVGRFGFAPLVWPVLVAVFVAVFTWSLLSTFLARRVRWSGRTIRLGGASTGFD